MTDFFRAREKKQLQQGEQFATGERFTTPHGAYVFKNQLPGIDLRCRASVEEQLFSVKAPVYRGSDTIDRSRKKKLRVRCGKGFYRVVLLNIKVRSHHCYIFGSNIKLHTCRLPPEHAWMARDTIVLPNPAKTTRNAIRNKYGFTLKIGRPKKPGPVLVAGILMECTAVGSICKVDFENRIYYAHPSVVFPV